MNDDANRAVRIDYAPQHVPLQSDPRHHRQSNAYSVRFASPQESARFFYGPKVFEELRAIDPELTRAINFGIFSWLAVPLLGALKWCRASSATGAGRSC